MGRQRETFTETLFEPSDVEYELPTFDRDDADGDRSEDGTEDDGVDDTALDDVTATLAQVKQRLDAIEDRLDGDENEVESSADSATRPLDADLTHRVVHAAMESDRIDEDEEVAIIAAVLDR